ncbi:MAG: hypothetical protein P8Y24_07310 [Gammaproteobacteria bacterium]
MACRFFSYKSIVYLFVAGLVTLLSACGGGGDGGGVQFPAAAVPYTGIGTPATLNPVDTTDTTTVSLDYSMVSNESQASEFVLGGTITTIENSDTESNEKARKVLSKFVKNKIEKDLASNQLVTGAGIVESGDCSLYGGSDGSLSSQTLEQSAGKVIVKMDFNNLCVTDGATYRVTMNGSIYVTATGDFQNTGNADRLEMYMPRLAVEYEDISIIPGDTTYLILTETIVMTFTYDNTGFPESYAMSVSVNVQYNGAVYKLEVSGSYDYFSDVEISSGALKFYHPDYGYVEYNVTTPFTYSCADGTPNSGEVVLTASNGSATFTVNDCHNYTVDVSLLSPL